MIPRTPAPRSLMETAIEAMRETVVDQRDDGKVPPRVGAVLVKADGTIERAARGELRSGDHAEYTLLDRKNAGARLDGAILYSTLEPCAPGARQPSKTCCAERIVAARIVEVYVGIEDPDPTVDRKGIDYLQRKGVVVHMFDADLQEIIRNENREFIDQALERAASGDANEQPPKLSLLEDPLPGADVDLLSDVAVESYRVRAGFPERRDSPEFQRRMIRQGLLQPNGTSVSPTGFGLLLFGVSPRDSLPQAGLLATIQYDGGSKESQDFEGPLVLIPGEFQDWLVNKLPNLLDRSQMHARRTTGDLPMEMIREGVVNALVHRDYDIQGAKSQVVIDTDTIVIRSPGRPVAPITIEHLQRFDAPMLSRNPRLHYVFAKMELAEERGLGLRALKERAAEAGLPLPTYRWNEPYLDLTLYRSKLSAERTLSPPVAEALSASERAGWQWLATQETVTSTEYASVMHVPKRTALNHLKKLTELGLLAQRGAGPSVRYDIVRG